MKLRRGPQGLRAIRETNLRSQYVERRKALDMEAQRHRMLRYRTRGHRTYDRVRKRDEGTWGLWDM